MSTLKVDTILKRTGTGTITLGQSGDTISVPSGATMDLSNATQTGVGGDNTPSFLVYSNSGTTVANDANVLIAFQDEQWDTDSAFDSSTNYRFTCPSGEAGKYFFGASVELNMTSAVGSTRTMIWKNGSSGINANVGGQAYYHATSVYGVLNMAVGDYVDCRVYQNSGGSLTSQTANHYTFFFGYKLIGI